MFQEINFKKIRPKSLFSRINMKLDDEADPKLYNSNFRLESYVIAYLNVSSEKHKDGEYRYSHHYTIILASHTDLANAEVVNLYWS